MAGTTMSWTSENVAPAEDEPKDIVKELIELHRKNTPGPETFHYELNKLSEGDSIYLRAAREIIALRRAAGLCQN